MRKITKSRKYPKKGKEWTKIEIKRFKRLYPIYSVSRLVNEFGRTGGAIAERARVYGLKKDVSKGYKGRPYDFRLWTDQETYFLRRNFKKMTCSDIAAALGRNMGSVIHKARDLGFKKAQKWTAKEDKLLKKLYYKRPLRELEDVFDCCDNVIFKKARKLGIPKRVKPWTDKELKFLKKNYGRMLVKEIARHVARPRKGIMYKASELGLRMDKEYRQRHFLRYWKPKQIDFLRKNYQQMTAREIAAVLGKSIAAVHGRVTLMGLKKMKN
jgi:hypothetical protein